MEPNAVPEMLKKREINLAGKRYSESGTYKEMKKAIMFFSREIECTSEAIETKNRAMFKMCKFRF